MATLDYNYVADLVVNAQTGDSDAFAELYAATYQRQISFCLHLLKRRISCSGRPSGNLYHCPEKSLEAEGPHAFNRMAEPD